MKKTLISILAALMVIVAVDAAFAEAVKEPAGVVPAASGQEEAYAQERASVIAAVQAAAPGAVIDYVVRERDDGRIEWDVFFKQNGVLGQAEVFEDGLEVRKVEMFNQSREDSLTASEAAAKLKNVLFSCRNLDEATVDAIRSEYTRLFLGPDKLIAPPWESCYTSKERALFQESTLHVRSWYQQYSYVPAGYPTHPDDHISLMMHFLALTTERAKVCFDENLLCGFLEKHKNAMPRTMLRYAIEKFSQERRQDFLKR